MTNQEAWQIARENTMACWWKGKSCLNMADMLNELKLAAKNEWIRLYGNAQFVVVGLEADHYNTLISAYLKLRELGVKLTAITPYRITPSGEIRMA